MTMLKKSSFFFLALTWALFSGTPSLHPQNHATPVIDETILKNIQNEISGSICFEHLRYLTTLHRIEGSKDYHEAARYITEKCREYGLKEADIESYPLRQENRKYWKYLSEYGRLWNLKKGELRLVEPFPMLIADSEYAPSAIADGSHSTHTVAELVFIDRGDREEDYAGKDVKGKLVLADHARQEMAVHKFGALGTIHFTNWPQYPEEDEAMHNMPIWTYGSSPKEQTFGFNISRKQGLFLKGLLDKGEKVVVEAFIEAEVIKDGSFELATAVIPGAEVPEEEFIFFAHLDHCKPGAHDNGSGCAVLLEMARTLSTLIQRNILPPPKRSIRFLWIPHVSGLNYYFLHHPEKIGRVKAGCNLDCVGANPVKYPLDFYVTLPPHSLPTFFTDITLNLVNDLNEMMTKASYGGPLEDLLFQPEGSRNMFRAILVPFGGASDHVTATPWPLKIPALQFFDWDYPPRHSQINFLEYIDPTNLRRVAYLGSIISYAFASSGEKNVPRLLNEARYQATQRLGKEMLKAKLLIEESPKETIHQHYLRGKNLILWGVSRESGILGSIDSLIKNNPELKSLGNENLGILMEESRSLQDQLKASYHRKCRSLGIEPQANIASTLSQEFHKTIPVFNPEMKAFPGCFRNNAYFIETLGEDFLSRYSGLEPAFRSGSRGLLESFNFIDGARSLADIYEAVQSELWSTEDSDKDSFSPDLVGSYFQLLKDARVIQFKEKH
jgi:aminopeptidase YwaD